MKLTLIEIKKEGGSRYYAGCWISKLLIKIRNRPSFTREHIKLLEEIGFYVEIVTKRKGPKI